MKKNTMIVSLAVLSLAVGGIVYVSSVANENAEFKMDYAAANADVRQIVLSAENVSPDGNGDFTITTAEGNNIYFESSGLTVADGKLNLAAGGFIKNPYKADGFKNKISGLTNISHERDSGSLKVDYTWGESLEAATPYYQRRNYVVPTVSAGYSFLDEKPNYLNIKASTDTVLTSLTLKYDCSVGAEGGDNLQISTSTMLERFKTVVNLGNDFEGQTVELGADIDMSETETTPIGNASYPFKGVFDGKEHIVSNLTLSGETMIAPFGNVVSGVVKNVNFENLSTTASGQRAAGVVARLENATVENANVLSGSIEGANQNGGIVGVSIGEVEIKSCLNGASVLGSNASKGGNGGILGYAYDNSSAFVYDCEVLGDVTSAGDQTTGGIVGAVAATSGKEAFAEINLCEVGKDVIVKANDTEATSARAKNGYLVGSSSTTLVSVVASGKVEAVINSVSDYTDFVSSCSSGYYEYKVAKLAADLDFEGSGSVITKLSGLLDGDGHKISNFTASGASQIALINNAYPGGVKDLVIENINTTVTTQRAAAIAGRAEKASFKDIEILSGTITGPKQNGGIVGAIVTSKTRIVNCINRADVVDNANVSTDGGNGGIVGIITSTGASAVIDNCKNYGSITASESSDIGGAGIVGYVSSFTASEVLSISNCENHGDVAVSAAGKSGILGYVGTVSAASTVAITDSTNTGAISGTGEYTGGIFGGWATKPSSASYILTVTIDGVVNSGSVNGTGNGTGGIVGATNSVQDYLVISILNSINRGAISGVAYVGGISGLIRNESTTNASIIDNCFNYGDVTSTSTGCGGISGTARINITNCGCYINATLKAASTTKLASAAAEIGTPGYIALNYETGCPTHTGNRLINLDGSDYTA